MRSQANGNRRFDRRDARFPHRSTPREGLRSSAAIDSIEKEGMVANELISCDDHMDLGQLPADLWTTRLPAALRDRAPRIEERNGQAAWVCDGKVWGSWGGKPPSTGNR